MRFHTATQTLLTTLLFAMDVTTAFTLFNPSIVTRPVGICSVSTSLHGQKGGMDAYEQQMKALMSGTSVSAGPSVASVTAPAGRADNYKSSPRWRKKTKQLATLGPASSSFEMIEKLFLAGADVFRLNFSHGAHAEKKELLDIIRQVEAKYEHPIAILGDLQGPKLRVGTFANPAGEILSARQTFRFDLDQTPGTNSRVMLPHPEIIEASKVGHFLLIDDGKVKVQVKATGPGYLDCEVIVPGLIKDKKGVNTPDSVLNISCLTPKDRKDLEYMLSIGVDWVALSFVQRPEDIVEIKRLIHEYSPNNPSPPHVMAKIEKPSVSERFIPNPILVEVYIYLINILL